MKARLRMWSWLIQIKTYLSILKNKIATYQMKCLHYQKNKKHPIIYASLNLWQLTLDQLLKWFDEFLSLYLVVGDPFNPIQRPIWLRIPWPVSSSVPMPMTKPSIAKRPFQVSAMMLKPYRGCVELVMFLIRWASLTYVRRCLLWSASYSWNAVWGLRRTGRHWIKLA